MCNLYRLDAPASAIAKLFDAMPGNDPWEADYVAPGKFAPVIIRSDTGLRLVPRQWGVPPPPKGNQVIVNIRNTESPFWIGSLRHTPNRCLVPVTSFMEWGGVKGARTRNWFAVPSEPVFAFAGLMRDSEVASYAFLTTDPNPMVARVHPKAMPVILHREDYDVWLNADWKDARRLVEPFPAERMAMAVE